MNIFHIYIHFPDKILNHISNIDLGKKFLTEFLMTIDLADCEKGSILHYSKSNLNSFFDSMELIQGEFKNVIGNYTIEEMFSIFFETANDFDSKPMFESNEYICYYRQWISENRSPIDCLDIFKEIFERKLKIENHEIEKILLLNIFEIDFKTKPIKIIKDCRVNNETIIKQFEFVKNFNELDSWLIENRLKRNYNFSDNRHIENHPDSLIISKGKSPLIDGLGGKKNASELLKNAIGDKRAEKDFNDLINCDTNNNNFHIWFEYENDNPQNQYHGYHLVTMGKPHKVNLIAEKRIPERVKKILAYRNK